MSEELAPFADIYNSPSKNGGIRTYHVLVRKYFKGPHLDDNGNAEVIDLQLIVAGLSRTFFVTGPGLKFEFFRVAFAACTGQDINNRISLVPYALGNRKDLAQKIAVYASLLAALT